MKRLIQSAAIAALLFGSIGSIHARGQAASPQDPAPQTSGPPTTAPTAKWFYELAQAANGNPSVQPKPVTYLGVSLEVPGEPLRAQLQLQDSVGLLVSWVDDQGPARDVLAKHDVITRLDDQIVVNAEQLQALVRMHKPGDLLDIRLVRNAKPTQVSVKLSEKSAAPAELANWANVRLENLVTNQFPYPLRDVNGLATAMNGATPIYVFNNALGQNMAWPTTQPFVAGQTIAWPATQPFVAPVYPRFQEIVLDVPDTKPDASPRATIAKRLYLDVTGVPASDAQIKAFVDDKSPDAYEKLVQELLKNRPVVIQPGELYAVSPKGAPGQTTPLRHVVMTDGIHRLEFETDGTVLLTIMDKKTGSVTFQGPVQKADQWKALPEDARTELDAWLRATDNWRLSVVEGANAPKEEKLK